MTSDASKWTEDDLLRLIASSVQENVQLDYKSCAALQNTDGKKSEISKDVSAFANSAGGVLVYGIVEVGHVPVRLDEGFDPNYLSKEWLEQVINSRIQRKVDGIRINPVDLPKTHPGKVAYVVVVPQSSRAPHQASDKRFYKRYNFESVPMEEYEIRDVSRRSEGPKLSIRFRTEGVTATQAGAGEQVNQVTRVKIMPLIENESPVPAEYITISIYVDTSVAKISDNGPLTKYDDLTLSVSGRDVVCNKLGMNHAIPGKIPIFSGTLFRLLDAPITLDIERDGDYFLGYSLLAPFMSQVFGGSMLRVRGRVAEVTPL